MSSTIEIRVPDIGNYQNIPVIEVLVKPGDAVAKDQGLVTLESDKATMEVPSTVAGVVKELRVKLGDGLSEGSVVAVIETAEGASDAARPSPKNTEANGAVPQAPKSSSIDTAPAATQKAVPSSGRNADLECQVAVLGSGPGGYTAAFRAADLGQSVVLIERYPALGGVCLNVGCIPSKALLHAARVMEEAHGLADYGIDYAAPKIDVNKLRGFKEGVVGKLTGGLAGMAKQRKVTRLQGVGRFVSPNDIEVDTPDGKKIVRFERCIIAAGSQAVKLPGLPWDDQRLMDSTDALQLQDIPKRLLVIGGGIIGLEMACVFDALGSKVSVVELLDQLMPGADPDLVKPLATRLNKRYESIRLKTKVTKIEPQKTGLKVFFESADAASPAPEPQLYDRVLVAVGRTPNGKKINAESAGVVVTERGFIPVDKQQRTNVPHIFAIGDVVGNPMLAHKATHEGKVAAEVCAGLNSEFVARVIPSVAYTDPEVAWVGVTELEAKNQGLHFGKGVFPHAASGRALGINRSEGFTKLIFDETHHRVIGAGIVGPNAGDLIAEVALAIEMGCEAADIGLTIHPHPTLSESVGMAAEVYEGTITDLYIPKKRT